MNRILSLVLLACVACGPEEDMARVPPRVAGAVIPSKNQLRINAQRTAATQDAAYAPIESLFNGRATSVYDLGATKSVGFADNRWFISRLKNIVTDVPVAAFHWTADGAGTQDSAVALFRGGVSDQGEVVLKMVGYRPPVPGEGFHRVWPLVQPVTLSHDVPWFIGHCTSTSSDFFGVELGSSDFVDGGGPVLTYASGPFDPPDEIRWRPGAGTPAAAIGFSGYTVVSIYSSPSYDPAADYAPFLRDLY